MSKMQYCPNCGKKGMYETDKVFLEEKTHRCKFCDMEFEKKLNNGQLCWIGDIPVFS